MIDITMLEYRDVTLPVNRSFTKTVRIFLMKYLDDPSINFDVIYRYGVLCDRSHHNQGQYLTMDSNKSIRVIIKKVGNFDLPNRFTTQMLSDFIDGINKQVLKSKFDNCLRISN